MTDKINKNKHSFEKLSSEIIGTALDVHKSLGPGFSESIYEKALIIGFKENKINFEAQVPIKLKYKKRHVGLYKLDLLVEKSIIVELKAVSCLNEIHQIQLLSYLRATSNKVGLLFNFSQKVLEIKRVVN